MPPGPLERIVRQQWRPHWLLASRNALLNWILGSTRDVSPGKAYQDGHNGNDHEAENSALQRKPQQAGRDPEQKFEHRVMSESRPERFPRNFTVDVYLRLFHCCLTTELSGRPR